MGLSTSLLVLAIAAGAVPVLVIGPRAPERVRDLEKAIVSACAVLVVGGVAVHVVHDLSFFGLVHLAYLVGVVTFPVLFGTWFVLSLRGPRRRIDSSFGALAVLLALLGLYGTHVEPRWLRVDERIVTADVPRPLRIGVIADLQTGSIGSHERNAINTVLDHDPDLVVIPGDWFQGDPETITEARQDFVALLQQLVANTQLVAVVSGDSDWSIPLQPMVEEAGALFIDDTVIGVEINGVPIRLAGVRVRADGSGRADTLAALSQPSDAFTLLVAHRPDAVYDLGDGADVDLVVAGHTHGGQVQVPFFGPPVTFSSVPRSLASGGLERVDGIAVYVSAGVGLERLQAPQVRFGARPEVGIIDIVPR